ncbi:hypothetical protein BDE02_01G284800 [Populus trichocarpa]|nr:hypothetical protein BDE02_01G284800 [Populus trichocarpa]
MRYSALKFRGQILYSRTSMEVEKAARELLQSLKVKKGVLPGKTAVMQICGNTSLCHAMHIFHSGITSLQFLLEDSTLVKVGVGISSDCAEVLRDYNVSVKSVEDLSYHANQKLGREPKTWGLRSSKDSCLQRASKAQQNQTWKLGSRCFIKRTTYNMLPLMPWFLGNYTKC